MARAWLTAMLPRRRHRTRGAATPARACERRDVDVRNNSLLGGISQTATQIVVCWLRKIVPSGKQKPEAKENALRHPNIAAPADKSISEKLFGLFCVIAPVAQCAPLHLRTRFNLNLYYDNKDT